MELLCITIFIAGYLLIIFEHPVQINKTASALITGVTLWTIIGIVPLSEHLLDMPGLPEFLERSRIMDPTTHNWSFQEIQQHWVENSLGHHLLEISQILFFLIGAMTIVELIDAHHGFSIVTSRISATSSTSLAWILSLTTFFLSALLDNLTTTIVMISVIRKLIQDRELKLMFSGLIIIAANAGGAWSPIGDVTTTMLWIGGQISAASIVSSTFAASLTCLLVPLLIISFKLRNSKPDFGETSSTAAGRKGTIMLISGILILIGVPVFKTITHLPPYQGMLLGLAILWIISELLNPAADEAEREPFSAAHALRRIDMSSVLFFLGILLSVGALQTLGILQQLAIRLDQSFSHQEIIITLIGIFSAIIDNVPLVAACMGMYDIHQFPTDSLLWQYLAYCTGTGGSILIIGSAAGVAAMGMEKIEFGWYLKKISWLALIGYLAGGAVFLLQHHLMN